MPSKYEKSEFQWSNDCSRNHNSSGCSSSSEIDNKNDEIDKDEGFLQFDNYEDDILWPIDNIEENEDENNNNLLIDSELDCGDGNNHFNDSQSITGKEIKPILVITDKKYMHKLASDVKDRLLLKNIKK